MANILAATAQAIEPATLDPRTAWANAARKVVTRADALHADGSLNQQFFKPKKVRGCVI
jgi:hypothetical protein